MTNPVTTYYDLAKLESASVALANANGLHGYDPILRDSKGDPLEFGSANTNAIAHTLSSAYLTYDNSAAEARTLGYAREYSQYWLDTKQPAPWDTFKDLYNNQVGRNIAAYALQNNLSRDQIQDLILDALSTGKLIVTQNDPRIDPSFNGNPFNYSTPGGDAAAWSGPSTGFADFATSVVRVTVASPNGSGNWTLQPTGMDIVITQSGPDSASDDVTQARIDIDSGNRLAQIEGTSANGTSTQTVFDTGTEPWSSQTSAFDAYQRLQSQRVVFDTGSQQTKEFDNTNNRIWDDREIVTDPTGNVTNVQLKLNGENQTRSTANIADYSAIGQIFGSAIGRAIVGKDGNPFVQLAAGTVAGFVGQKFVQALINGPDAIDLAQVDLGDVFFGQGVSLAGAGLGAASSFLTAEIATSIGLNGVGAQMFNAAVGGYLGSVLNQVRAQGFNVLTAVVDWNVALHASEVNIASAFGSFLAHQFVHPESQFGAVGGQLAGAVGSALAYSFSVGLGSALNVFLPGVGAFFGTIIGTIIGDAIAGDPAYPKAFHDVEIIGSDPNHFQNRLFGTDDHGNAAISKEMGDQVTKIANSYLDAVHGAAIYYSGKVMIGYNAGAAPYQYITGWFPDGTTGPSAHFSSATDAIQEGVRELLQNTEVLGGDLLVKRAHQAFINGPHAAPTEIASDFTDLASLGGDLRTAQDYEQYLNDRETINALIELYPNSAFTAGWAATFARVKELGLDHVHGSDFIGGLVGYLDSVAKAGLGAEAANATVKRGSDNSVIVEIKIANGAEVPGSLSVFADHLKITSDAGGQTLQFTVDSGLGASGTLLLGPGYGTGGHDIMVGGAGDDAFAGGAGFDFIDGGAGSDYLFGQDGNDILRGGRDADYLFGGLGDDTYVFNRGDDADIVLDGGGTDTLVFGPGITPMDGFVRSSGNNVILGVRNPANPNAAFEQLTDKITLANWDDPLAIAA
jgi:hypothetical protein